MLHLHHPHMTLFSFLSILLLLLRPLDKEMVLLSILPLLFLLPLNKG